MLRVLAPDLWVCEQPLRFVGLALGTRMTVIRLATGELLLCSPVRPTAELRLEVDTLGPVRFLVAPNRFHHLFIGDWQAAYPAAEAWAAPGLAEKRRDLAFHGVLDGAGGAWASDVEHLWLRGSPPLNEVALLHRPSRTLVLTDSAFNLVRDLPWGTRLVMRAIGGYGGFKTTLFERLVARDRAAARAAIEAVLAWDFDRVIVAHGDVLERGGPAALRDAYAWLLSPA